MPFVPTSDGLQLPLVMASVLQLPSFTSAGESLRRLAVGRCRMALQLAPQGAGRALPGRVLLHQFLLNLQGFWICSSSFIKEIQAGDMKVLQGLGLLFRRSMVFEHAWHAWTNGCQT